MKRYAIVPHAKQRMDERGIRAEWIERVLDQPDESMLQDPERARWRFWRKIEDYGGRSLCVICDERSDHIEIVTAFFDRSKKP